MAAFQAALVPACQCGRPKRRGFHRWVRKTPWRKKWQPILVFSPGESQGQRGLSDYSPRGCKESAQMVDLLIRGGIDSLHVWNGNGPPTAGTPKRPRSMSPSAPSGMWVLSRQGQAFLVSANPTAYSGVWPILMSQLISDEQTLLKMSAFVRGFIKTGALDLNAWQFQILSTLKSSTAI